MTVDVALVTSEALVLGCDRIASVTGLYLDPLDFIDRDANGIFKVDENGQAAESSGRNHGRPLRSFCLPLTCASLRNI
jgi:hypothetical protein